LIFKALLFFISILIPLEVFAGFTQTLPQSTWLLDASYNLSVVENMWDDDCKISETLLLGGSPSGGAKVTSNVFPSLSYGSVEIEGCGASYSTSSS